MHVSLSAVCHLARFTWHRRLMTKHTPLVQGIRPRDTRMGAYDARVNRGFAHAGHVTFMRAHHISPLGTYVRMHVCTYVCMYVGTRV